MKAEILSVQTRDDRANTESERKLSSAAWPSPGFRCTSLLLARGLKKPVRTRARSRYVHQAGKASMQPPSLKRFHLLES